MWNFSSSTIKWSIYHLHCTFLQYIGYVCVMPLANSIENITYFCCVFGHSQVCSEKVGHSLEHGWGIWGCWREQSTRKIWWWMEVKLAVVLYCTVLLFFRWNCKIPVRDIDSETMWSRFLCVNQEYVFFSLSVLI